MSKKRLMEIIARLEEKIMDLEEALDRALATWYKKAQNGEQKDDA